MMETYDLIFHDQKYRELLFYSTASLLEILYTYPFTELFCPFHHHSYYWIKICSGRYKIESIFIHIKSEHFKYDVILYTKYFLIF